MASLANQTISSSYDGLIKTSSDNAVPVSGVQALEDGSGNALALSVGRSGNGVTVSGNLAVDTNTLYVDAASDSVSINDNVTANVPLTVTTNSGYEDVLYLKSSGTNIDSRISMFPTGTGNAVINAATNSLEFQTAGSEAMRIDSSGNVGINCIPSYRLDIRGVSGNGSYGQINISGTGSARNTIYGDNSGIVIIDADKDNVASDSRFQINVDGSEAMRINSSGNVGIGTNSPFSVNGTNLEIATASTSFPSRLVFNHTGGGRQYAFQNQVDGALAIVDFTASTERMRIDSSGRVLVNTQTAQNTATGRGNVTIGGNSSVGSILNLSIDDTNAGYLFHSGTDMQVVNSKNGAMRFYTNDSERMRITSGGFLKASNNGYVGASSNNHEITQDLAGNSTINIYHQGTTPYGTYNQFTGAAPNNTTSWFSYYADNVAVRCIIYSNGNIVNANNSYGAISDAKLKENVTDASPKLDDLLQVKVRNFNYIGDDKKQLGVVAQELEEVFPSMIDESPDFEEQEVIDEEGNVTKERVDLGTTTKSVKYSVFVPMLIKAMQEQQEIINDLKARIETLEAK